MKIIDIILKDAGYTKHFLLECEKSGRTNGMGGKGGIQWTDELRKLKLFNSDKEKSLLINLDLISDIHDLKFELGGGVYDYLKANYNLIIRILQLLYWTTVTGRLIILIPAFIGLNIFGIRYFNWTCVWKRN